MKKYRVNTRYSDQGHNELWPVGKTQKLHGEWNTPVDDEYALFTDYYEWKKKKSCRLVKVYLKDKKYLEQMRGNLTNRTSYL